MQEQVDNTFLSRNETSLKSSQVRHEQKSPSDIHGRFSQTGSFRKESRPSENRRASVPSEIYIQDEVSAQTRQGSHTGSTNILQSHEKNFQKMALSKRFIQNFILRHREHVQRKSNRDG